MSIIDVIERCGVLLEQLFSQEAKQADQSTSIPLSIMESTKVNIVLHTVFG